MFAANALGLVAAGSLHLAFLSPAAWRRWIEERAASQKPLSPATAASRAQGRGSGPRP
jgi:hypothetical protein